MKKPLLIVGVAGAALALMSLKTGKTSQYADETNVIDDISAQTDLLIGAIMPGPVENFTTSQAMRDMLKAREQLRLTRYALGDGGYTIGYGHYSTNIDDIPERITVAEAEQMFDEDIVARGERWVKTYITVPLDQNQFDALVSIAYNMSPRSFKKFADSVNAGQGIDTIAQQSVAWVPPNLQNGIQNRRNDEVAVFNYGVYA